ncbi:3-oxoacyl-[acyl-carrier protein] reductase [Dyadobacter sp. BE34]|uniref:3-oxoacyl-[acyl-carrier protein] reductase n=1 Tax=Dyadobacter fermentans TaxID=94254 RepID=A0ABU1R5S4_9BACT|nr:MULTISPECIES: 3-oxoacyl-ACP reductase FabG [Dyadobacter]MDR6808761.1 3-oxoacyl-[acyl-carrier protein] reductase [Dyadobacter fermentans]MDR7046504.1 3-oxoacyl-[acyl-carrier protein] reductase [Dyadobacter sp. BE242]MDR7200817.1 3-oxoacyl-[acyl-carrier protein] reductase [Dyadobacter sp. BE34]MDR7218777.1 3-oxoacyl-[acyl-carrier protein] reductase [Dyadobacter sp. BE31]MDR7266707.1 3-oxoacyl-[acyl-carrier protein] reductase [Dyadobacter sp. BE32]
MNCALVTGASRGLGRAIAVQLAKDHGLHILVNYASNQAAAEETLAEIQANGGSGELLHFNVQNKPEVDEALNGWREKNEDKFIGVLVNNAGITRDGLFMWMPEKDWDDVLNISVKGLYNVTQNAIQQMLRKRSGRIINIASVSGMKGVAGQTNYSAAKGAIIAATKSLSQEVAKRKITVNAVAPGFITSDMTKDLNEDELKQMIPMNRFGKADEVAHLVSFLASDKAAYITGEVININGGIYS